MPDDLKRRLEGENLTEAYEQRPPYQQNDYIGWINLAKREATREKRINQLIDELHAGNTYMGMAWGETPKKAVKKKAQTFGEFLDSSSSTQKALMREVNTCLMKITPGFTTKQAWGGWAYMVKQNYSCLLVPYKDHVKLMLMRGTLLKDPKSKLKGSGTSTRHVRFDEKADIDCEYLRTLINQQHALYKTGLSWEDR